MNKLLPIEGILLLMIFATSVAAIVFMLFEVWKS